MFIKKIANRIKQRYKQRLFLKKASLGRGTYISYNASISVEDGSIQVGECGHISCSLISQAKGKIIIGDNLFAGGNTVIGAVNRIEIGSNVIISNNVHIYDNNNHPIEPERRIQMSQSHNFHGPLWKWDQSVSKPIFIEDNVWIGEFSSILKGVTIGEGSIVAAKSVVTKDIPPFCIVAGNPARVVKWLIVDEG